MSKRKKSLNRNTSLGRSGTSFTTALPLGTAAGLVLIAVVALIAYMPFHKRRLHLGRLSFACRQPVGQSLGRFAPNMVHRASDRLLAGHQYFILDRVADMGDELHRLPCHQPRLARCRITADLDHLKKVVHSRGAFSGLDLCRASGERGVGGLDRATEKHDGDVVFFVVDFVVCEIPSG